jgi:hypothetical protein
MLLDVYMSLINKTAIKQSNKYILRNSMLLYQWATFYDTKG